MSIQKKKSFFDCLKTIYQTKDVKQMEEDIASPTFGTFFSKYMIIRYLSMEPKYLKIIKNHQHVMEAMSNEMFYRYCMKVIPQNRNMWINYIAKKKKK